MYAEDRVYTREAALNLGVKVALNNGGDPLELAKAYEAWITEPVAGDKERENEGGFSQVLSKVLPSD